MERSRRFTWKSVFVTFCFLLTLQYTASYSEDDRTSQPRKVSAPCLTAPKRERRSVPDDKVDYSNGFPSGFTEGLPNFDFTGSITSANPSDGNTADTENIGFAHGPPKGFPSFSQLGANFPSFSDYGQSQQRRNQQEQHYNPTSNHGTSPGSGPSGFHNSNGYGPPNPPPKPLRLTNLRQRPYRRPQQQKFRPDSTGSPENSQYALTGNNYEQNQHSQQQYHQQNKPIVLKVSTKKSGPTKLPPPPPPFYAPSPDLQVLNQKNNPNTNGEQNQGLATYQHHPRPQHRDRYRREAKTIKETQMNITDQVLDGSEDAYWETTSPFIHFDNYEKDESKVGSDSEHEIQNSSSIDPEAGEQRFFPSFPPQNPYLGINPYVSVPQARPPLFPGPTANRAPSRYHPQFGNTKYTQGTLPPNRGPSGVYSTIAETHDHGDRYQDNNLLGSGNFEVVRGGTYYDDDDGYHPGFNNGQDHQQGGEDSDYYHHNGHSSPSGFRPPGSDFFANFRDFADINPPARSFSHNYETLTLDAAASERQPKNILDKLQSRAASHVDRHSMSLDSDPMMATY